MGSFSSPLSGLMAAQEQLQTISNNLANMNTDGYKDQNLTFSDVFAQTGATNGSGDPVQTGSGVSVSSTDSDFTEGNLNNTGTSSNMAISGNGFFVLQGSGSSVNYTRAGDFTTNNAGQLTTPGGELVLGYPAVGGTVNTSAALQPLQVGSVTSPAVASTTMQITANLDAASSVGASTSSALSVYDSLGTAHALSITYTMSGPNTWSYQVTVPSSELTPAGTGTTTVASGSMNFNNEGVLVSTEPTGGTATLEPSAGIAVSIPPTGFSFTDGAAPMAVNWSLLANGTPTITQTASASATSASSTNGFASGTLSSYAVQGDGTIVGTFSSGNTLSLGQVAVLPLPIPRASPTLAAIIISQPQHRHGRCRTSGNGRSRNHCGRLGGAVEREYCHRIRQADCGAAGLLGERQVHYNLQPGFSGDTANDSVRGRLREFLALH